MDKCEEHSSHSKSESGASQDKPKQGEARALHTAWRSPDVRRHSLDILTAMHEFETLEIQTQPAALTLRHDELLWWAEQLT
jgi:hypothetical protein